MGGLIPAVTPGIRGGTSFPGVPVYGSNKYFYDPVRSCYNFDCPSMQQARAWIAEAVAGNQITYFDILGDSLSSGYQVSGIETANTMAWPGQGDTFLNASPFSYANWGSSGIIPAADAQHDTRWVYTANWATFGAFYGSTGAGTATATLGTLTIAGNLVFSYLDTSVAFTYQINGGAAVPVAPGGTSTVKTITVAEVAGAYTLVINAAGAGVYICGAGLIAGSGVVMNNVAQTASGILAGYAGLLVGHAGSWSGAVNYADVGAMRLTMLGQLPAGKHVPILACGSNDICVGLVSPAAAIAGFKDIVANRLPAGSTTPGILLPFRQPSVTDAQWNAWGSAIYQYADSIDTFVIDWNDRVGGYTNALANGLLQSDVIHGNIGANYNLGLSVAQAIAA